MPNIAPCSWSGAKNANAAQPAGPRRSNGTVDRRAAAIIRPTHAAATASTGKNVSGIQAAANHGA